MFSATKFVVAGAIVALFGGFLLAGVLTQPSEDRRPVIGASASATTQAEPSQAATSEPEPTPGVEAETSTTTTDLLPGVDLVTEETEPGVFRVLSDGVRDLTEGRYGANRVVAGDDGSVWAFWPSAYFRLGGAETAWETEDEGDGSGGKAMRLFEDIEVDRYGTIWRVPGDGTLRAFDGDDWSSRQGPDGAAITQVELDDGSVWAAWLNADNSGTGNLGYIDEDDWIVWHPRPFDRMAIDFVVSDFEPWVYTHEGTPGTLFRWSGGWVDETPTSLIGVAAGADGTLWARGAGSLFRWDPESRQWTRFGEDGMPNVPAQVGQAELIPLQVGAHGSVWLQAWQPEGHANECNGLINFRPDPPPGQSAWRSLLPGLCITSMDVAPNGSLWVAVNGNLAGRSPDELYVITPEAVAGTE